MAQAAKVTVNQEQIVLCGPHARDYREAGEQITLDNTVTIKEPCELCTALGWTYQIQRRSHGQAAGAQYLKAGVILCDH